MSQQTNEIIYRNGSFSNFYYPETAPIKKYNKQYTFEFTTDLTAISPTNLSIGNYSYDLDNFVYVSGKTDYAITSGEHFIRGFIIVLCDIANEAPEFNFSEVYANTELIELPSEIGDTVSGELQLIPETTL